MSDYQPKSGTKLAFEYAKRYDADIVVANDPDCDRIGIVIFDKENNPLLIFLKPKIPGVIFSGAISSFDNLYKNL